ncbi:hypothetical protein HU200_049507 [Digitaria exilis]|uniref:Flotillin-like n=1 Tax=Digitaria exilis TaxID=1010633 RepID=A0A835AZC8_9POAL|nr:hypothetical protein HU200_049507 [Digitaria exilis]
MAHHHIAHMRAKQTHQGAGKPTRPPHHVDENPNPASIPEHAARDDQTIAAEVLLFANGRLALRFHGNDGWTQMRASRCFPSKDSTAGLLPGAQPHQTTQRGISPNKDSVSKKKKNPTNDSKGRTPGLGHDQTSRPRTTSLSPSAAAHPKTPIPSVPSIPSSSPPLPAYISSRAKQPQEGREGKGRAEQSGEMASFKVADASEYLAITGWGIDDVKLAKKAWKFDITPVNYEFEVRAMSSEKLPFILPAVFTIGPKISEDGRNRESLLLYAKLIAPHDKNSSHVRELVKGVIEGETRVLAASMTMEEIFQGTKSFKQAVFENVQLELNQFGLYIYNANVKQLVDVPGQEYFSYLGQKTQQGAVNQAKVDVAEARMFGAYPGAGPLPGASVAPLPAGGISSELMMFLDWPCSKKKTRRSVVVRRRRSLQDGEPYAGEDVAVLGEQNLIAPISRAGSQGGNGVGGTCSRRWCARSADDGEADLQQRKDLKEAMVSEAPALAGGVRAAPTMGRQICSRGRKRSTTLQKAAEVDAQTKVFRVRQEAIGVKEQAKVEAEVKVFENEREAVVAAAKADLATKKAAWDRQTKVAEVEASKAVAIREAELQMEVEQKNALRLTEKLKAEQLSKATVQYDMQKAAEAKLYEQQKAAEARKAQADAQFFEQKLAEDAKLYAKQKEAESLATVGKAKADYVASMLQALGGNYHALRDYMMIDGGLYQDMARINAGAVSGMQPKISIWTNGGADGAGDLAAAGGGAAMQQVAGVYKMLPPLLSTVHEQTGMLPPAWMGVLPAAKEEAN